MALHHVTHPQGSIYFSSQIKGRRNSFSGFLFPVMALVSEVCIVTFDLFIPLLSFFSPKYLISNLKVQKVLSWKRKSLLELVRLQRQFKQCK